MAWIRGLLGAGAIVAAAGTAALAARRQRALLAHTEAALLAAYDDRLGARVDFATLADVPPPVERYLRRVLVDGQPRIRSARLRQDGTLRTAIDRDRWTAFEATQLVVTDAPGFVWDARVGLAPLLHMRVRDAFVDERGSSTVLLASTVPVASAADGEAISAGALQRYLAEAVWYPTALLPSHRLAWSAGDDRSALATLTAGATTVALEFRFDEVDLVSGVFTPARWAQVHGGFAQRPWEGRFAAYRRHDGVMVPLHGEAGWHVDGAYRSVWRGRWTELRYEFAAS